MKKAHLLDGIAMTKFIFWLKSNVGKIPMDEMMLGDKLEHFRGMAKSYVGPSFAPIVGYQITVPSYITAPQKRVVTMFCRRGLS